MKPLCSKNRSLYQLSKVQYFFLALSLFWVVIAIFLSKDSPYLPTTLFYYASNIPVDRAVKFQRVIVEPENTTQQELEYLKKNGVMVYAYLSIGEVGGYRSWASKIDKSWILGKNKNWQTSVMDMTHPDWLDFLIAKQVTPLWQAGYQGFFLDTMDSYQLFTDQEESRLRQRQGIITLIKSMDTQFTDIHFLFNRGFEVLDEVAELSDGVVAESLFAGWDPTISSYKEINQEDRQWLLDKLIYVREKYQLPITVIDYLPSEQKARAGEISRKISALGFVPWVSTVELDQIERKPTKLF